MRPPRHSHAGRVRAPVSLLERLLLALGTDADVAEAVIGDLAEEYSMRRAHRGAAIAGFLFAHEALRSASHFLWNAIRHGGPVVRARIAVLVATCALLVTLVLATLMSLDGPPSRLVADAGKGADGLIVNNVRPVQLDINAFDAKGHHLSSRDVRFRWASGVPATVSPTGAVTCTHDGDAIVRTSLEAVTSDVIVQCRRVKELQAGTWLDFVVGDSASPLPYVALGIDGNPVTTLRGEAYIMDSSVAKLSGASIRPTGVGQTGVDVRIGDRRAAIMVNVYARVHTFDALRGDQRLVAIPIHLARGDTLRFALPREEFWLAYVPRQHEDAPPTITLDGLITCVPAVSMGIYRAAPGERRMHCVVHSAAAGVTLAHGSSGATQVNGALALQRVNR